MAEYEHFEVQYLDDVAIVHILETKLLQPETLESVRSELLDFAEAAQPDKLLIFFERVEYCTSAAISAFLSLKRRIAVYGGEVKICGLKEPVRESFDRLGLSGKVFDVYDTITDALESFGVE